MRRRRRSALAFPPRRRPHAPARATPLSVPAPPRTIAAVASSRCIIARGADDAGRGHGGAASRLDTIALARRERGQDGSRARHSASCRPRDDFLSGVDESCCGRGVAAVGLDMITLARPATRRFRPASRRSRRRSRAGRGLSLAVEYCLRGRAAAASRHFGDTLASSDSLEASILERSLLVRFGRVNEGVERAVGRAGKGFLNVKMRGKRGAWARLQQTF